MAHFLAVDEQAHALVLLLDLDGHVAERIGFVGKRILDGDVFRAERREIMHGNEQFAVLIVEPHIESVRGKSAGRGDGGFVHETDRDPRVGGSRFVRIVAVPKPVDVERCAQCAFVHGQGSL